MGALEAFRGSALGIATPWLRTNVGRVRTAYMCPRTCDTCEGQANLQPEITACMPGWSFADGQCYKYDYSDYRHEGSKFFRTWHNAEEICQGQGSHLALVETRAQEELVFQLVRQRPREVAVHGLWAWVGMWTGFWGCNGTGRWAWVGAPQSGHGAYMDTRLNCGCEESPCTNFLYTNNVDAGETHVFSRNRKPEAAMSAWICSRPAALLAFKGESCEASGLLPITDLATCEAASRELLGMHRVIIEVDSDVVRLSGCWMRNAHRGPRLSKSLGGDSSTAPKWAGQNVTHICRRPNVSGQAAEASPAAEVADPWQLPVMLMPAADSSPAMIALLLLLGGLPAMGLLLLAGHRLSRRAWLRCGALLSAARELRARWGVGRKDKFARAIQARLHTWRDAAAGIVALLLIAFHLSKLIQTLLVPGSVCASGTISRKRELLAGVELANIWAAMAFLLRAGGLLRSGAGRRGGVGGRGGGSSGSSRWRHAFVFCAMALGVAEAALLPEQSLLVESRVYRDLLLRILMGACASLTPALLGNALVSVATCGLYRAFIPDGRIFTVATSPTGFSQPGCNSMWDPSVADQIKIGIKGAGHLFAGPHRAVEGVDDLIDDLLSKKTSFSTFLSAEVVLFLVIAVFLALLHEFLRVDAARSLQLRSSEEQLTAFSKVLDNYCDATFQLTSDCCIADKGQKLDSLLHLAPSVIGLQGRSFPDMIASAGQREDFQTDLRPDAGPGGLLSGGAMFLDLNAAGHSSVRVQLLCAPFEDMNGERRLLCGINEVQNDLGEYTEHTPLPKFNKKKGQRMPGHDEMPRERTEGHGTPARHPRSGDLSESSSESGVSSGRSEPARSISGQRVDVAASNFTAEVELTDSDARFLARNTAFLHLMGLVENPARARKDLFLSHLVRNPSGALATLRTLGCAGAPREATLSFDATCRDAQLEVQAVAVDASEPGPRSAPRRVIMRLLSVMSTKRRRQRRSAERGSLAESTPRVVGKPSEEHRESL